MPSGIFIGLMSGLASAVLFFAVSRGPLLLKVVLFVLAPLPMMIAGLSYGWRAAIAAAIAGAAVMMASSELLALIFFVAFGIPAILTAWLTQLGARTRRGNTTWLPAADILASLAVAGAAVPTLLALVAGGSFASMKPTILSFLRDFTKQMEQQINTPRLDEARIEQLAQVMIDSLPGVIAAYWMILFAINLYLAGRVARTSGLLVRPWPDLHRLTPPPWLLLLLVAALFLWMTAGLPKLLGTSLLGSLSIVFVLLGLSVLHALAKGRVPWLLWLAYAALLNPAGPYAMMLIAMIGLLEPLLNLRDRFAKTAGPPVT